MVPDLPPAGHVTPVTKHCIIRSAKAMGIPTSVVTLILHLEGGKVGVASKNRNGSYDLGPMQINTIWLPYFKKRGISAASLRDNGCINVLAGVHILSKEIRRSGSVVKGIGRYHSRTKKYQRRYLRRAAALLKRGLSLSRILKKVNGK